MSCLVSQLFSAQNGSFAHSWYDPNHHTIIGSSSRQSRARCAPHLPVRTTQQQQQHSRLEWRMDGCFKNKHFPNGPCTKNTVSFAPWHPPQHTADLQTSTETSFGRTDSVYPGLLLNTGGPTTNTTTTNPIQRRSFTTNRKRGWCNNFTNRTTASPPHLTHIPPSFPSSFCQSGCVGGCCGLDCVQVRVCCCCCCCLAKTETLIALQQIDHHCQ